MRSFAQSAATSVSTRRRTPLAIKQLAARGPTLQRHAACACGGGCPRCTAISDSDSSALKSTLDGAPAITDYKEANAVAIDAPPVASRSSTPAPPRTCPTDIRVAELIPLQLKANNVAEGFHTGVGGIAKMQVKDSSGRDWAGTQIHETIISGTNACQPGTAACPNSQGVGGAGGSTFKVGDASSAFGVSLPAQKNCFYDWHMAVTKPSLLHQQNLTSCEQKCSQRYSCGDQFFGPTFTIHRTMSRDQITSGGTAVDVSRVHLEKPQNPGPPGDYPAPALPPGDAFA
jgi:hypothetical protein